MCAPWRDSRPRNGRREFPEKGSAFRPPWKPTRPEPGGSAADKPRRTTTRSERPAAPRGRIRAAKPEEPASLTRRAQTPAQRADGKTGERRLGSGRPEEAAAVQESLEPQVGFMRPVVTRPTKLVSGIADQEIAHRGEFKNFRRSGRGRSLGTGRAAATGGKG